MTKRATNPRWDHHDPLLDARPAASLDLHGLTRSQAEAALRSWLAASARRHTGKVVHVVTGKGKGSAGAAVLKPAARAVIKGAGAIVADWDKDVDGGGFLVRLR